MTVDRPGCLIWCGQCPAKVCRRADNEAKVRAGEASVDRTYCERCDTWHAWKHQDGS